MPKLKKFLWPTFLTLAWAGSLAAWIHVLYKAWVIAEAPAGDLGYYIGMICSCYLVVGLVVGTTWFFCDEP